MEAIQKENYAQQEEYQETVPWLICLKYSFISRYVSTPINKCILNISKCEERVWNSEKWLNILFVNDLFIRLS